MNKRGILVIILFLLSLSLVQASLNINLVKASYSPGSSINGYFSYGFSGAKNTNTPVKIYIDGELVSTEDNNELGKIVNGEVTPASYTDAGTPSDNKEIIFNDAESKTELGIKITSISNKDLFNIESVSLDVSGDLNNNNNYPMLPSLDFNDDSIDDWQYIGSLTGEYKDLKKSYLSKSTGEKSVGLDKSGKTFCEKVDLKPSLILPASTSYDIKVRIKQSDKWATKGSNIKLWGFIKDVDSGGSSPSSYNCDSSKSECCSITDPTNTNFDEYGCSTKINNFVVEEEKDYFICIYQTSGTDSYYTIEAESYSGNVQGWYNGISTQIGSGGLENNYDYFIWGKYGVYKTNLTSTDSPAIINNIASINDKIEGYVKNCNTNDCIIPIKISTEGSGKIRLSNLKLGYNYGGPIEINQFIKVNTIPEKVTYDSIFNYELNFINTPTTEGEHKIRVVIGDESAEADFSVVPVPEAVIYYEPWTITTGIPVYFTAEGSSSPTGANITKYGWNFGDKSYANGSNVTHIYKLPGEMKVTLNITDENGFVSEAIETINVLSLNQTLEDKLNLSEEFINVAKTKVASSQEYVKDTASLLGLDSKWDTALTQIKLLKTRYNATRNLNETQREKELLAVYNELMNLMNNIPQDITVQAFQFPAGIASLAELPSASELKISGAKEDFEQAVLAYQEGVNIEGDARAVSLIYLSGNEEKFILVKKTISSTKTINGKIYELIPSGIMGNIITPGYSIVSLDKIYSWPIESRTIIYTLNETDAQYGIDTRTIIIPALKDLKFGKSEEEILEAGFDCGNGVCDFGEDEISCPEDCSRHYPWFLIISIFLMAIAGVYYFSFYKGPLNYKEIGKNFGNAVKSKPKIFKSKDEEKKLINFVKVSRERGLNENQTKYMLKSKGWNDAQINEAIKKTAPPQRKVIKLKPQ